MRKTVTDGRTDGHHHTIIRPVWRRAYKNGKFWCSQPAVSRSNTIAVQLVCVHIGPIFFGFIQLRNKNLQCDVNLSYETTSNFHLKRNNNYTSVHMKNLDNFIRVILCELKFQTFQVYRTRQIIRYRATATLRRLQKRQYTASNEGGGEGLQNKRLKFGQNM